MVETDYTADAGATALSTLVNSTRTSVSQKLPSSRVAPLFSTSQSGAIVDRNGREVRPPVKRAGAPAAGSQ